jgi:pilus assembly protein CpaC
VISIGYVRSIVVGLGLLVTATVCAQRTFGAAPFDDDEPVEERAPQNSLSDNRNKLRLNIGEQKVLSAEGVRSFSEGTKGIVEIRLTKDNQRFVLVGTRAGRTTVLLIMLDGDVVEYDVTVDDPNAPAKQEVLTGIQPRDNIRLDFYFVQLSNTHGYNIGVSWPTSIGAESAMSLGFNLQTGVMTEATATVTAQALPRLDLAQSSGWAKVMRKAAVITANGASATVSGGGEINIPLSGGFGGSLKQVNYGTQISVQPRYDKNTGRIELQIVADVSDLTPDGGTGAPGRTTSTLETLVNLELGQSLVLAGLSSESVTKGRAGLAGLSQIPILGALFGTHTASGGGTQMAIFIVPSVMDTVNLQQRALITEALQTFERYTGDLARTRPMVPPSPQSRPR